MIHDTYGDAASSVLLYAHTHGLWSRESMVVYSSEGVPLTPRHYGENPFELLTRVSELYGEGHWTLEPHHRTEQVGTGSSIAQGSDAARFTPDDDAMPWPTI